jgi:hypothetical protein
MSKKYKMWCQFSSEVMGKKKEKIKKTMRIMRSVFADILKHVVLICSFE